MARPLWWNGLSRECVLCGKEFLVPESAPHKKFCCAEHRVEWHREREKRARELLKQAEQSGEGDRE